MPPALVGSRPAEAKSPARPRAPGSWLFIFVALQLTLQLMLLVESINQARVLIRSGAFLASITLLALLPLRRTPATALDGFGLAILAIVSVGAFVPATDHPVAAFAQLGLYLAVLGPLFWVRRLDLDPQVYQRVVLLFWGFYLASATLGVLQAVFPGSFQPAVSSVLQQRAGYLSGLQVELSTGTALRPMGLTDIPGGAAQGGLFSLLLGAGLLISARPAFRGARGLALAGMVIGGICLYLCQVRSLVVMASIALIALTGVLASTGRLRLLSFLIPPLLLATLLAFVVAEALGGETMLARLSTLTEGDLGTVYYENRGRFLQHTLDELLWEYPFGAGMGRWGMMNHYFGSRAQSIWVEIQWTGWLLDGGILLVLAYASAILVATWKAFELARANHSGVLGAWAPIIVAYDVGALALCFNSPFFVSTSGVEFWILNAGLLQAASFGSERPALDTPQRSERRSFFANSTPRRPFTAR